MEPQNTTSIAQDLARTNRLKLIWGLICLIGPSVLILVALILYALINMLVGSIQPVLNIGLYLIGIISILTWLPGIIVGVILLATRKKI